MAGILDDLKSDLDAALTGELRNATLWTYTLIDEGYGNSTPVYDQSYSCQGIRGSYDAEYAGLSGIPREAAKIEILASTLSVEPTRLDKVSVDDGDSPAEWWIITQIAIDPLARGGSPMRRDGCAGMTRASGANARKSSRSQDRRRSVPLSLPGKNSGAADVACRFLETLKIPEGPKAGQKLRLADFQKTFIRGALDPANMVALLSIGRGNSKTATAAGIALGAVIGEWDKQPKREILLAARNRDQAKIAFNFIVGYIERLPKAKRELFTVRRGSRLEVEFAGNGGGLARCIAADGRSILGGAPTLAILDERAAWEREKGDLLENAILSGLGKRGGKCLIISTSAPDDANTFSRWLDEPPPGTYVQEHRPPFGLPADDAESLLIANPGAAEGIGASLEWLQAQDPAASPAAARLFPASASSIETSASRPRAAPFWSRSTNGCGPKWLRRAAGA